MCFCFFLITSERGLKVVNKKRKEEKCCFFFSRSGRLENGYEERAAGAVSFFFPSFLFCFCFAPMNTARKQESSAWSEPTHYALSFEGVS